MTAHTIKHTSQRSSTGRKKAKRITDEYLHNYGLYYLQRFASSRSNFISVMDRKIKKSCRDHPEQNYDTCRLMLITLTDKFERAGLLNDTVYTGNVVHSLRRRGLSQKSILMKLAQKGISPDKTLKKLAEEDHGVEDAEFTAALTLARRKKIGPFCRMPDEKSQQKFFGAMARAGYSYDIARRVLEEKI